MKSVDVFSSGRPRFNASPRAWTSTRTFAQGFRALCERVLKTSIAACAARAARYVLSHD